MSGGVSISMASSCGTVEHAPYTDLQANGSVEIPVRVKVDSNAPEGRCKVSATLSWYNTNFQKVDTTANAEFDVLEKPRIEVPGGDYNNLHGNQQSLSRSVHQGKPRLDGVPYIGIGFDQGPRWKYVCRFLPSRG